MREVVFPAVAGGSRRCGSWWRVQDEGPGVSADGADHAARLVYRALPIRVIALLDVLEFRCINTAHRPVIDALGLISRYAAGCWMLNVSVRVVSLRVQPLSGSRGRPTRTVGGPQP
jgi:hypothetical protein